MSIHIDCSDLAIARERVRKMFTPGEATRSLTLVRGIVADVMAEHSNLLEQQEVIEAAHSGADTGQARVARDSMFQSVRRLRNCMGEIDLIGAELLDWSLGVVEFPCLANGREVRLCWQPGQQTVGHWHEVGEDCGRRRRIDWT